MLTDRRVVLRTGFVGVSLVVAVACRSTLKPNPTQVELNVFKGASVAFVATAGMCAEHRQDTLQSLTEKGMAFADSNGYYSWCIPEYHDDQRLSDGGSDLGPIAHVIASPKISMYDHHSQYDTGFVNVALVDLDTIDKPVPPTYQALGLQQTRSCMYVAHKHVFGWEWFPAGAKFEGLMVPANPVTGKCPASATPASGVPLTAREESYSNLKKDYPPVARFVTDAAGSHTLINVPCTRKSCSFGVPAAGSGVPVSAHNAVAALKTTEHGNVKGWFDDQRLGVLAVGSSSYGILPQARASLIPDPDLANRTVADYVGPSFTKVVARAYFPDEPPLKYRNGGFSRDTTTIWLRAEIVPKPGAPPGVMDTNWYSRIVPSIGTPVMKTVKRTDHSKWLTSLPGTARWRWKDKDEDVWVQCAIGCCMIPAT